MALRNLQVGDDLSGKTLYFTLDVNNQTQLDNSIGLNYEIPFKDTFMVMLFILKINFSAKKNLYARLNNVN